MLDSHSSLIIPFSSDLCAIFYSLYFSEYLFYSLYFYECLSVTHLSDGAVCHFFFIIFPWVFECRSFEWPVCYILFIYLFECLSVTHSSDLWAIFHLLYFPEYASLQALLINNPNLLFHSLFFFFCLPFFDPPDLEKDYQAKIDKLKQGERSQPLL